MASKGTNHHRTDHHPHTHHRTKTIRLCLFAIALLICQTVDAFRLENKIDASDPKSNSRSNETNNNNNRTLNSQTKTVSSSTVEMFCEEINSPKSRNLKQVVQQFDQQNDFLIADDFKEAHMDQRIASTISNIMKQFFKENFCKALYKQIGLDEKRQRAEIHGPLHKVAALNDYIARLMNTLEGAQKNKPQESKLMQGLQALAHDLAVVGQEALNQLQVIKRVLLPNKTQVSAELTATRTQVLGHLVDMFLNEAIMSESSGMLAVLYQNLTLEKCFEPHVQLDNPKMKVTCAFRFLFHSSKKLKELIDHNLRYQTDDHSFTASWSSGQCTGRSTFRTTGGAELAEHACKLKERIEHHQECDGLPPGAVHTYKSADCVEAHIRLEFPDNLHNKLHMALQSGGPNNLAEVVLQRICNNHSPGFVMLALDVGQYFQSVLRILQGQQSIATTTTTTVTPPVHRTSRVPESMRQEYIIQSIIVYFLRAAEQRLQCAL